VEKMRAVIAAIVLTADHDKLRVDLTGVLAGIPGARNYRELTLPV
jgi:hypothetical protein